MDFLLDLLLDILLDFAPVLQVRETSRRPQPAAPRDSRVALLHAPPHEGPHLRRVGLENLSGAVFVSSSPCVRVVFPLCSCRLPLVDFVTWSCSWRGAYGRERGLGERGRWACSCIRWGAHGGETGRTGCIREGKRACGVHTGEK